MWASEGLKVNPAAGTVLADTGALSGAVTLTFIVSTDVAFTINLVHKDALSTGLHKQSIPVLLAPFVSFVLSFKLALNESIRLETDSDVKGSVQATILSS